MKAKHFTPLRLKLALIALPLLLAALYYAFIASDRYVSESIVAVRSASVSGNPYGGSVGVSSGIGMLAWEDTLYLLDYVHSDGLLKELEGRLKLREHYEAPRADLLFRLWPGSSHEWFKRYFESRVELKFNDLNGLLTIRTQGFDAAMAEKINRAILESSERFVNDFSHRVAREQMRFSQTETEAAATRLQAAKAKLIEFQTKHKILDPVAQQSAANALTAELQATVSRLEADLKNKLSFMQPDAPAVVTLRDQLTAYRSQLETEKARTTSAQSADRLGPLSAEYYNLQLETTFAEDAYKSANAALESARIEAARKLKSLVIVEPPSTPETAEYPARLYNLLTLLVLCTIIYLVVRLSVAAIQEHQD